MDQSHFFALDSLGVVPSTRRGWSTRVALLRMLCIGEEVSQRHLVEQTKLTPSTVSRTIAALKSSGMVLEGAPISADRVGPKEVSLHINPKAGWAAGIQLLPKHYRLCLIDASGEMIASESYPIEPMDNLLRSVGTRIDELAKSCRLSQAKFCGIGIGTPGILSPDDGEIVSSRGLHLQAYPLREELKRHLRHPAPIYVERLAVCSAYAEHYLGAAGDTNDFVYLHVRMADSLIYFAGAFIVEGKVYRGFNNAAGEIRVMSLFPKEELGPLDSLENVQEAAARWGKILGFIVNLIDPERLVIGTDKSIPFDDTAFEILKRELHQALLIRQNRRFSVVRAALEEDSGVRGAALLALHRGLVARLRDL